AKSTWRPARNLIATISRRISPCPPFCTTREAVVGARSSPSRLQATILVFSTAPARAGIFASCRPSPRPLVALGHFELRCDLEDRPPLAVEGSHAREVGQKMAVEAPVAGTEVVETVLA